MGGHVTIYMSSVKHVIQISRVTFVTSNIMDMFFISDIKYSFLSTDIFQWTIQAFHLVNATSAILISLYMGLYYILYCVLSTEGYFYSRALKEFRNPSYFFATECVGGPFYCLMLKVRVCFAFVGEVFSD
jgi:hypothetical protein